MKKDTIKWTCKHCGVPIAKSTIDTRDWYHLPNGYYNCQNEEYNMLVDSDSPTEALPDLFKHYYRQLHEKV